MPVIPYLSSLEAVAEKADGYVDAFLAAMAEHLGWQYYLAVPAWCRNPERKVEKRVFAVKTPEGRMFLIVESPTSFRPRNIFVSADALTRV